jgi:hypothetical protein
VVCERPKLAPHRDAMQRNLSDAVGAPVDQGQPGRGPRGPGSHRGHRLLGRGRGRIGSVTRSPRPSTRSTRSTA